MHFSYAGFTLSSLHTVVEVEPWSFHANNICRKTSVIYIIAAANNRKSLHKNNNVVIEVQTSWTASHLADTMTASPSLHLRAGIDFRHCLDSRKRPGKNIDPAARMVSMVPGRSVWGAESSAGKLVLEIRLWNTQHIDACEWTTAGGNSRV